MVVQQNGPIAITQGLSQNTSKVLSKINIFRDISEIHNNVNRLHYSC